METKLTRIAEIAKTRPKEKFTSLAHLINEEMLVQCHVEMKANKAPGIDGTTKLEYEENLEQNIDDLLHRMKSRAYRPIPVRRTYIPKPGTDKLRPLGIPGYEDKLVQMAVTKILTAIYEPMFLDCSFGFRPGRGCHDAVKALEHNMTKYQTQYVVDTDIKGFFNHVSHEWMMTFLQHRISDPNLLQIINRFLKAGVLEAGIRYDTLEGTPQGGVISPILANIYLYYVLDLWFYRVVRLYCKGAAFMVRYADDHVACFKHKEEAEAYYRAMVKRLDRFNLEIAEEKTKIIPFGQRAWYQYKCLKHKKPQTFDFLGFTHYCSQSLKGYFRVKRKTSKKKFRASMLRVKEWIKANRTLPLKDIMRILQRKLVGYYQYYGITDNSSMLSLFLHEVRRTLFKWLNRRSQRASYNWTQFVKLLTFYPLPRPRVYVNIFDLRREICYSL